MGSRRCQYVEGAIVCGPKPPTEADCAEIERFKRYLRGEMGEAERHAYLHAEKPHDVAALAKTIDITRGGGTIREAREAAGLSLGQAVRLVPWDRVHMEAIEATGVMSPEERRALCDIYDVAGFADEYGVRGGDRG